MAFERIKAFIAKNRASKQEQSSKQVVFQLGAGTYGGLVPMFVADGGDIFNSEAAISCLQTNATYCSKAEFSSVRIVAETGEQKHDYKKLDKILQLSPNPLNTAAVFWERVAWFYFKYSNAFIYIERDPFGEVIALWSVDPSTVRFQKISTGEIVLQFTLNGKQLNIPYGMIIHIARNVTADALFGKNFNGSIRRIIDLINLNYKGIEKAILTSSLVRFIGKFTTKMSDEQKTKAAEEFTENFLSVNKDKPVAIAVADSVMEVDPVTNSKQDYANYPTMNQWNQAVYKFFGCPEKVIMGTANEDEMTAYYERTIDVFLMRAAQEMTRKLFTDGEHSAGNRIVYSDRKMQYLPMKTRMELFNAAREIGAFTLGTLGDILGLPVPADKRNEIAYSQNYTNRTTGSGKTEPKDNKTGEDKNNDKDNPNKEEPKEGETNVNK